MDLGGREPPHSGVVIEEQNEAALTAFELSAEEINMDVLNLSIASRTIISAARGGHLRRLTVRGLHVEPPFAIRALMPCWVRVKFWNVGAHEDEVSKPFQLTQSPC